MKNLIKKIALAKKEIGKISKDSTNPFYKSKYFDINQLLEHVEYILDKNGLLILQPITDNKVCTQIFDIETGTKIESCIELPQLIDPQKLGSAITYYRRYTLQSLLSLQAEDDDGNTASKNSKEIKITDWLSKENFEKTLNSNKKSINAVLRKYNNSGIYGMKKEYKNQLLTKLKELK